MPIEEAPELVMSDERELVFEDFAGRVGELFRVRLGDSGERLIRLLKATARDKTSGSPTRPNQFSVAFYDAEASVQEHLPQGTYHLENDTLGGLDLFIVPLGTGDGGKGIEYEAVFNRMQR